MALFESYERREKQILAVLEQYGIKTIEECADICKEKGLDIYKLVESIQKYVINPYYVSIGEINPELDESSDADDEEVIFEDMGGKEKPIEKRKKTKGKRIS